MISFKKLILSFIAGLIAGLIVLLNHNATKKKTKAVLDNTINVSGKDSHLAKHIQENYKRDVKHMTKEVESMDKRDLVNKFKEKFKI